MKESKYFLKDNALNSVDDDFFRHQDVKNNIIRILKNTQPPYNIAVIGKWGLGKSSLINMVTHAIEQTPQDYLKVEINAWKYEKEALAKVFLRQVMQEIEPENKKTTIEKIADYFKSLFHNTDIESDNKKISLKELIEDVKSIFNRKRKKKKEQSRVCSFMREKLGIDIKLFAMWAAITALAYTIYRLVDYAVLVEVQPTITQKIASIFTGYCRNIGKLLFAPWILSIITKIYEEVHSNDLKSPKLQVLDSISVEDYEIYLEREIERLKREKHNDNFKIVIILDDLDRLSVPKMVEALDAIKMFIDYKNCIFIVPFDDTIIKRAIQKERLNDIENIDIQSELLLDKLFQYKVYLPQLLLFDIKKYASDICKKEIPDFIDEYMDRDWDLFEYIVQHILIHNSVETPRQVKKIVNTFVSNVMIARGRQNAGHVEKNFATTKENLYIIAKLSVLQADFNEFYDLLFVVSDAIDKTLDAYQEKTSIEDVPAPLRAYFMIDDKFSVTHDKFEPLLNFLHNTSRFSTESVLPYLYMAMDDISIKTGTKRQQRFRNALLSRNFVSVREQLKELPELIEYATYIINNENDSNAIANAFYGIVNAFDLITSKTNVIKSITRACERIVDTMEAEDDAILNYNNLLDLYQECSIEDKIEIEKLLSHCLCINSNKGIYEKTNIFVSKHSCLSVELINILHEFINSILKSKAISLEKFVSMKNNYALDYDDTWAMNYYLLLIEFVSENEDFSDTNIAEIEKTYAYITSTETADTVFSELEPLFGIPYLVSMFFRILSMTENDTISISITSKLIECQLENRIEDTYDVNPFLLSIPYKINTENTSIYISYFNEQVKQKEFSKLITNYCKHNDISLINASILSFINYLFENITVQNENTLKNIMGLLNVTQLDTVIKRIEKEIAYVNGKTVYGDIGTILLICVSRDDGLEKIVPMLLKWINYIQTSLTSTQYVDFILDCSSYIIDYFDNKTKATLFTMVQKMLSEGKLSETAINITCNMEIHIPDDNLKALIPLLCNKISKQTCICIFNLMEKHWEMVEKLNTEDKYVEAALMSMHLEQYIDMVIECIDNHFSSLDENELEEFITCIIQSTKVNVVRAFDISSHFIDSLDDQKSAASLFMKLLANDDNETTKVITLTSLCKKYTLKDTLEYIISISGEYKLGVVITLLDGLLSIKDEVQIPKHNLYINNLCLCAVSKSETEDDFMEIINIIDEITKEQYQGYSEKYVNAFTVLFNRTSSRELKQKLYNKAKEMRIGKKIRISLPDSMQNEWNSYIPKRNSLKRN